MKNCLYCHRVFQKTEHLLRHQRSHTGERPFLCLECGRRYGRSDVLQRHIKSFHCQSDATESRKKKQNNRTVAKFRQSSLSLVAVSDVVSPADSPPPLAVTDRSWDEPVQLNPEINRLASPPLAGDSMTTSLQSLSYPSGDICNLYSGQLSQNRNNIVERRHEIHFHGDIISQDGRISDYESFMGDTQLSADIFDILINGDNSIFDTEELSRADSCSAEGRAAELLIARRASVIPTERFTKVARLWPNRMGTSAASRLETNFWNEVVSLPTSNICIQSSDADIRDGSGCDLTIDENQRQVLINEFTPGHTLERRGDTSHVPDTAFPSTRLLSLSLGLAFRYPHLPLSFIHQPTFSIKRAPPLIAFALCLLGLGRFDCKQTREFMRVYFPTAVDKCCIKLSQTALGQDHIPEILINLSAAIILLIAWHIRPVHGPINTNEALRAQSLYNQALSLAQMSGLLFPQPDEATPAPFLNGSFGSPDRTEEQIWMAWARAESVKRLIATLIVVDAWWSYNLEIPPIIRARSVRLKLVCSDDLFQSPSSRAWKRLVNDGFRITSPRVMLQIQPPLMDLSIVQDQGALGMMSLLCLLWIWILDLRRCMLPDAQVHDYSERLLVVAPVATYATVESGRGVCYMLNEIYAQIPRSFQYSDTNCIILWHFLNLQLLANIASFELAAGRDGAERARLALRDIAVWSQTDYARRACLHGAGIYTAMMRRRINDGTVLYSETALFAAALVVGLYTFMVKPKTAPAEIIDSEPYELLDDVDWPAIDAQGLHSASSVPLSHAGLAALQFVREGGAFSFSGMICDGGYHSAKVILLDFANLLHEAGKRDARGLCHILRIMSDSLPDINDD